MQKDKRFLGDKGMALITVLLMAGIIVLMTTSTVTLYTYKDVFVDFVRNPLKRRVDQFMFKHTLLEKMK